MAGALENGVDTLYHQEVDDEPMENGGNLFAPDNEVEMDVPNITMKVCIKLHILQLYF
jgi:hypothetical protein